MAHFLQVLLIQPNNNHTCQMLLVQVSKPEEGQLSFERKLKEEQAKGGGSEITETLQQQRILEGLVLCISMTAVSSEGQSRLALCRGASSGFCLTPDERGRALGGGTMADDRNPHARKIFQG
jgi:hypothetical protein